MPRRDVSYLKGARYKHFKTLTELSEIVDRDPSRLIQLEREDRIPKASRVTRGQLQVRLWSPAQVEEVKEIISKLKPGRPRSR